MKVQMPRQIVGDHSTMLEAFIKCAVVIGETRSYATELVRLLPQELKEAPVWFDKLTNMWRYEYGLPFDGMPEDTIISGTNVHFPVNELYDSMRLADRYLTKEQMPVFLKRMADHEKHEDVIFEMRPMLQVDRSRKVHYEVPGFGVGNTTFDWIIEYGFYRIVLDVKNRTKSLVNHMKEITALLNTGAENILPPAPNPADLFKSVETKLLRRCSLRQLQGVWIQSGIKEDEKKLESYFKDSLDKRKVHFAVISNWQNDAYILARSSKIIRLLQRIFKLTISNRYVTQDYSS